jgi:hypothetical protein
MFRFTGKQDGANSFRSWRSARLPGQKHIKPQRGETIPKHLRLRAFACAFAAFQRYEFPFRH